MRLSKQASELHEQACELLKKGVLTLEERMFVLDNWQESASHLNGLAGAFFTPEGLAIDLSIEVSSPNVVDLCAGIGRLAFAIERRFEFEGGAKITCVELNPDYVAVGRKVMPNATWICGDVRKVHGTFDCAVSNPPFGRVSGSLKGPFEFEVIEVAARVANYGVFIIPQRSAPFEYSGKQQYRERPSAEYEKFSQRTGIKLIASCGFDTSIYQYEWRGVSPSVEIVCAEFEEVAV